MIIRLVTLLLALSAVSASAQETPPLFEFQGKSYSVEDLSARMQQLHGAVLQDHYRAMRTLVDEMLFDVYVEQEAARQKRPPREVGRELLKVPDPTDAEVRNFYNQLQTRINQSFDKVNERLKKELKRERLLQHRAQLIARLKSEGKFELLLPVPPATVAVINTRGRPLRGEPSAPITLVEFADYLCVNCKRAVKVINDVLREYPKDVKLIYIDYPNDPSGISREVARGAVCAQNQGKFWAFHDAAYTSQSTLNKDSSPKLAEQVGVDMKRFEACMKDPATTAKVSAGLDEGRRLGVTTTPTLFVDGRPFPSKHLMKDLAAYIEKWRAKQATAKDEPS